MHIQLTHYSLKALRIMLAIDLKVIKWKSSDRKCFFVFFLNL